MPPTEYSAADGVSKLAEHLSEPGVPTETSRKALEEFPLTVEGLYEVSHSALSEHGQLLPTCL